MRSPASRTSTRWASCCTRSLTGEVPFSARNQIAVATMHVREELPDVQRKRPEVSAALAAVLERATAKQLARRYAARTRADRRPRGGARDRGGAHGEPARPRGDDRAAQLAPGGVAPAAAAPAPPRGARRRSGDRDRRDGDPRAGGALEHALAARRLPANVPRSPGELPVNLAQTRRRRLQPFRHRPGEPPAPSAARDRRRPRHLLADRRPTTTARCSAGRASASTSTPAPASPPTRRS